MPSYYLYKIRKGCEAQQDKLLSFFDSLTPENFNELKNAKSAYADCIRKVKRENVNSSKAVST